MHPVARRVGHPIDDVSDTAPPGVSFALFVHPRVKPAGSLRSSVPVFIFVFIWLPFFSVPDTLVIIIIVIVVVIVVVVIVFT